MKKLLFILSSVLSLNLFAMEKQTSTIHRSFFGQASLASLPKDLKSVIISCLASSMIVKDSTRTIRSLSKVNKCFYNLVNDSKTTEKLIDILSNEIEKLRLYIAIKAPTSLYWKVFASDQLRTLGALQWLKNHANEARIQEYLAERLNTILEYRVFQTDAIKTRLQLMRFLLKAHADPNAIVIDRPLLFLATYQEDTVAIELLLFYGAQINLLSHGNTPLDIAHAFNAKASFIESLKSHGAKTAAELNQQGPS